MATHNELGKQGEDLAVAHLKRENYTILEQNWRYQKAEVDIIALKKGILAVIEVKTRTTAYFGDPQDFVKKKKIRLLVAAIDHYVISRNLEVEVRFDIIAILAAGGKFKLEHLEDAFLHF